MSIAASRSVRTLMSIARLELGVAKVRKDLNLSRADGIN